MNTALPSVEIALQGLNSRNKNLARNIANVNTSNYKRKFTTFEQQLREVQKGNRKSDIPMKISNNKHYKNSIFDIRDVKVKTEVDNVSDLNVNKNNVDIDMEMVTLGKTGMNYKAISQMARREFDSMRSVMRGGN